MSFNATKCYVMAITNKKQQSSFLYSLSGCVLSKVPGNTYLGVTLREDLQWESHITSDIKANRTLGFLWQNLRYCPKELWELTYNSLVRSPLAYASIVWDPYLARDITKLVNVQRRAARFVANDHRRTSSIITMLDTTTYYSQVTNMSAPLNSSSQTPDHIARPHACHNSFHNFDFTFHILKGKPQFPD